MEPEGEDHAQRDWELNEIETLKALVRFYKQNFDQVTKADREQFATHEELLYAFRKILECFECSLTQMTRMSDCMYRLTDNVEKLTDEVIYLKGLLDDGD